jgi:pyruvate formate lyase activating enzyme
VTGKIHSFESFGAADGPGVRFIVFLHGCPLRCVYCHNPDTWANEKPAMEFSPEEVLKRALRYRDYWGEKGGITVSGGEPLLQAEFVAELFELTHREGVTTCLDTSGASFRRGDVAIERLISATDTVLLDIKAFDSKLHREVTGADNSQILDFARYLSEKGVSTWIRRVIVPDLTDGEDELKKTGEFINSLKNIERIEVLPYHDFGVEKWRNLGIKYPLEGVYPADDAAVQRARKFIMQPR